MIKQGNQTKQFQIDTHIILSWQYFALNLFSLSTLMKKFVHGNKWMEKTKHASLKLRYGFAVEYQKSYVKEEFFFFFFVGVGSVTLFKNSTILSFISRTDIVLEQRKKSNERRLYVQTRDIWFYGMFLLIYTVLPTMWDLQSEQVSLS